MKKLFTILLITVLFVSCSSDKDDGSNSMPTSLEGKWILTDATCYCLFGNNPDFSGHKLTFEGTNLNVENTGNLNFLTNAAGRFTLQGNLITLKNGDQYTYELKPNTLSLTFVDNPQIADDELLLIYTQG